MCDQEAQHSVDNENLCVVCFKTAEIYSIGVCDHPVCFECSTRMRVLCRQNECPICRQDMPKVIFTKTKELFSSLFPKFERSNLQDRRYGVLFCTLDIKKLYDKLLEHRCQVCSDSERNWIFRTFQQLKEHMRRDHEFHFCDICVENLKIFTSERRCYTRQELAHHRRKGDPDNKSHRGHPLCEFCDTRYMDSDELFRHLRRNHLYCHFCDADGKHQYYNNMEDLVRHFKEEHYLCEEGECKAMPLTAMFRTDIDLKAHIATEHSRHMSKHATKQARTLELEFTLAPRVRSDNMRNKRYTDRRDRSDEDTIPNSHNIEPGGPGGGGKKSTSGLFVNPLTSQDFPALGGNDTNVQRPVTTVNFTSKLNSNFSREDFPMLGGSRYNPTPEVTITRTVRGQQGASKTNDDFPALGGPNSSSTGNASSTVRLSVNSSQDPKSAKVSIQVDHRPNGGITTHITTSASSTSTLQRATEAFPALGNATNITQPQWVKVKNKKQESKNSKVAPTPQLPPSSLEQFPTLSKKGTAPPSGSNNTNDWVNLNSINTTRSASSSNKQNTSNANSKNNNSAPKNDNKKTETKSSSSKSKQLTLEQRVQDLKLVEVSESKNKNKKKKTKNSDSLSNKSSGSKVGNNSSVTNSNEALNANSLLNEQQTLNSEVNEQLSASVTQSKNKNNLKSNGQNAINGLIKRSELKIGTLTTSGESSLLSTDFPALGQAKPSPPPGFNVKPPPGLSPSSFPSLGTNDLTFTTSRGQSYSITPSNNYHQPNNFQTRNQNLIKRLMTILNNNDSIKEFKTYSDLFRNGGYPTANYYDHCKTVLANSFDDIFPELLVLLPDIQKQQELFNYYDGKSKKNLVVCEHCKQIIFKKELSEHYNYHVLENQFPTLGKVHQVDNVWHK